ncbi:hypothetical protein [Streptomyces sp. TE33382]
MNGNIAAAETAIMSDEALSSFVVAVRSDALETQQAVASRVDGSKNADSVCMMGGWTAA